jgi:UDP-N-acetylmuramate dehydrogenase
VRIEGKSVSALCGAQLSAVAEAAARTSLTGLEFAHGIPGSVGGAVYMNAGAYGGEIGGVIESARVLTPDSAVISVGADGMAFSYRDSRFRSSGEVVLEARFALARGSESDIRARMAELARRRAEKQPLNMPCAGSFFKRPEGGFAGKLIEETGLAGLSCGGAMVSPKHAGFIVNAGGATASEIVDLMEIVRGAVFDRFGVMLEPEVRIIGDDL